MDARKRLGGRGEKLAASFLRRRGYRLVARNYTCPVGEADLIVVDGATLVFVEVRTRHEGEINPETTVTQAKRDAVSAVVRSFLSETNAWALPCRVDIVAVTIREKQPPSIEHWVDAFNMNATRARH